MANTQVQTVSDAGSNIKLVLAALFAIAGFAAFYFLSSNDVWIKWGSLLIALAVSIVIFLTSEPGKRLIAFGRDSWREVQKVVWPARKETIQTTVFVFCFAVVMAIFLWATDKTLEWLLYDLILGWRG